MISYHLKSKHLSWDIPQKLEFMINYHLQSEHLSWDIPQKLEFMTNHYFKNEHLRWDIPQKLEFMINYHLKNEHLSWDIPQKLEFMKQKKPTWLPTLKECLGSYAHFWKLLWFGRGEIHEWENYLSESVVIGVVVGQGDRLGPVNFTKARASKWAKV